MELIAKNKNKISYSNFVTLRAIRKSLELNITQQRTNRKISWKIWLKKYTWSTWSKSKQKNQKILKMKKNENELLEFIKTGKSYSSFDAKKTQ